MRILYFSQAYTTHDHRFLQAMRTADLQTWFLRLEAPGQAEKMDLPEGVRVVAWPGGHAPQRQSAQQMERRRLLQTLDVDLVHAGPVQTCLFLAGLAGAKPLVGMSWGSDLLVEALSSPAARRKAQAALHRSDFLLADCQAVRSVAMELGFPAERIRVFPWGVDLQQFTPAVSKGQAIRERLGWQEAVVVLSLRSWEPIYGVEGAVKGFARAAQRDPRLRLLLLSAGSLEARIHDQIARLGLGDKVHLPGRIGQADLPAWYQAADVYLSASHSDGSSVSLLEALASGLPALVSDIPGNREWVQPGGNGLLFPVEDAQALADRLLELAADAALRQRMGERSREVAIARADWTTNQKILIETYHEALA